MSHKTMHALRLIEIAETLAVHAESQLRLKAAFPKNSSHAYWLAGRYQHEVWSEQLATHRQKVEEAGSQARLELWNAIVPTIQEVFLTEPLARCVAHHAQLADEEFVDSEFAALAHSAWNTHVEARNRCLNLLVFGTGIPTDRVAQLNRLRQHCERLTDQLLALMPPVCLQDRYAFDPVRTQQIRTELRRNGFPTHLVRLYQSAWSAWFTRKTALDIDYRTANPLQTMQLVEAANGLFARDLFDSFGVPISVRHAISAGKTKGMDCEAATQPSATKYASPLDILSSQAGREVTEFPMKRW